MRPRTLLLAQTFGSLSANALPKGVEERDLIGINTSLPDALTLSELYGAPANDFTCKSERNPVVMLHGLSANREVDLNMLQYELNRRGYCTFSKTYGAWPLVPWIGGLRTMADSAKDIADFVKEVKDKTGASKVDIVGHSEGGVQSIYVPMTQPGISDIVEHLVALGPAIHGAKYYGFTDLWYIGGNVTRALAKVVQDALGCPACDDMMTGGAVYTQFQRNAGHIAQPGNKVTVIMSKSDTLVAPDVSEINEAGVNNVFVQDTCPDDTVGHAGLMWDKSVWRLIVNALEENTDAVFACDKGLPI
ncbi:alpha/beta-hydrolase [Annulohypoxylon maeteangense]|uniref:alpha/beta-hydrolase n=1 Tax=Annulohypoxylon maeteangense TaxID=1927788 RepID=UPI002008DE47|nr:alpha/beta-hydrolase [Annulohypoxylon maeteangense]KAI0884382.1 alpha/beta-hydrolase [Annulohypoxylon maeteangense]